MSDEPCANCGKPVVCDIIDSVVVDGRKVRIKKSAPHGCPPEFDQCEVTAKELGIEDEVNALFEVIK